MEEVEAVGMYQSLDLVDFMVMEVLDISLVEGEDMDGPL